MRRFRLTKYGLGEDPRGHHVKLEYRGRTLLGEVTAVNIDRNRGLTNLDVRHFNGECWPINPHVMAVEVLER